MERNQFTWYRSYYEALKTLPAKDFKAVVLAVCAYALDEQAPSLSGVPNSVFTLIRPTLDSGRNKAKNRLNKVKSSENKSTTNEEQINNKPEQTRKENEGEREGEREEESERENDMLKILPPCGGNTKSPPPLTAVSPPVSVAAEVQADYLNRVNPMASPAALDELAGYAAVLGPDVCKRAFDIALDERKSSWSYIRAILADKQQRGVRCLADWDALIDRRKRDRQQSPESGGRKDWTQICEEMEGGR